MEAEYIQYRETFERISIIKIFVFKGNSHTYSKINDVKNVLRLSSLIIESVLAEWGV